MNRRLARAIIRLSACLVPTHLRGRWTEEWLAEIEARCQAQSLGARAQGQPTALRRALGSPRDAALLRLSTWSRPRLEPGWRADLRDAWRGWRRTPLQSALIVVSLTIGSAVLFIAAAYINVMVLAELPGITNRSGLALVYQGTGRSAPPPADVIELQRRDDLGVDLALIHETWVNVLSPTRGVDVKVSFASGNVFGVLGTRPALGRLLQPQDDEPTAPEVAVISHAYWQRQLGARPDVLGMRLTFVDATAPGGARSVEIVGVLEPGFAGVSSGNLGRTVAQRNTIWASQRAMPADSGDRFALARLQAGHSWRQSEAALAAAHQSLGPEPDGRARSPLRYAHFFFAPVSDPLEIAGFSAVLVSVPAIVLVIACLNIACLQIARAAARQRELVTRAALGASGGRLVRLFALDVGGLAVIATVAAWLVARVVLTLSGEAMPVEIHLDWRLALLALSLPIGVTVLAGWLPTKRLRRLGSSGMLRPGGVDPLQRARTLRVLVVGQLALSIGLLLAGSLVVRGAVSLGARGPDAITRSQVVAGRVRSLERNPPASARRDVLRQVSDLAAALPYAPAIALSSADVVSFRPMVMGASASAPRAERRSEEGAYVSPSYLEVLGRRFVAGRAFTAGELNATVVNEAFVAERLNGGPALGRTLAVFPPDEPGRDLVIVGVVAGGWSRQFLLGSRAAPQPEIFAPLGGYAPATLTVYARSPQAPSLTPAFARMLSELPSSVDGGSYGVLGDFLAGQLAPLVWLGRALNLISLVALALATLGFFGVVSLMVTRRTREFGVRYALGARPLEIRWLVLRDSAWLTGLGVAIGLTLAIPIFLVLRGSFVGVEPGDPLSTAIAVGVLTIAGLIAAIWPARRASAVDPLVALRSE